MWSLKLGLVYILYETGLAAPAIAAGFGALAPTLGTLVPVIGASGFAAAASAAGTATGSVAVAASFGGKVKTIPQWIKVLIMYYQIYLKLCI